MNWNQMPIQVGMFFFQYTPSSFTLFYIAWKLKNNWFITEISYLSWCKLSRFWLMLLFHDTLTCTLACSYIFHSIFTVDISIFIKYLERWCCRMLWDFVSVFPLDPMLPDNPMWKSTKVAQMKHMCVYETHISCRA